MKNNAKKHAAVPRKRHDIEEEVEKEEVEKEETAEKDKELSHADAEHESTDQSPMLPLSPGSPVAHSDLASAMQSVDGDDDVAASAATTTTAAAATTI
jgi:hypothetical protein